jgi:hypothetical protein
MRAAKDDVDASNLRARSVAVLAGGHRGSHDAHQPGAGPADRAALGLSYRHGCFDQGGHGVENTDLFSSQVQLCRGHQCAELTDHAGAGDGGHYGRFYLQPRQRDCGDFRSTCRGDLIQGGDDCEALVGEIATGHLLACGAGEVFS